MEDNLIWLNKAVPVFNDRLLPAIWSVAIATDVLVEKWVSEMIQDWSSKGNCGWGSSMVAITGRQDLQNYILPATGRSLGGVAISGFV